MAKKFGLVILFVAIAAAVIIFGSGFSFVSDIIGVDVNSDQIKQLLPSSKSVNDTVTDIGDNISELTYTANKTIVNPVSEQVVESAKQLGVAVGVVEKQIIDSVKQIDRAADIPQRVTNTIEQIQEVGIQNFNFSKSDSSGSFTNDLAFDIDVIEQKVFELTNAERTKRGLTALSLDGKLSSIARGHSADMADRNYFSHDTPEGYSPNYRAQDSGYDCRKDYGTYYTQGIAENIFQNWLFDSYTKFGNIRTVYDWSTEAEIAVSSVDGWMDSTGHRENILKPEYDKIGVGVAISDDDGAVYLTQNFC